MNERTHFFIKIYLSHFILERVDVGCVWKVSWRRGQTAKYCPSSTSFSSWLVCLNVGYWGPKASWFTRFGVLSPTDSNCTWNWPKPSVAPVYIIVWRSPSSTVPPLIYTGASLDWRLGRGSVYNTINESNKSVWKLFVLDIDTI